MDPFSITGTAGLVARDLQVINALYYFYEKLKYTSFGWKIEGSAGNFATPWSRTPTAWTKQRGIGCYHPELIQGMHDLIRKIAGRVTEARCLYQKISLSTALPDEEEHQHSGITGPNAVLSSYQKASVWNDMGCDLKVEVRAQGLLRVNRVI